MNQGRPNFWKIVAVLLLLVVALPLSAAGRRRAASHPSNPAPAGPGGRLTGTVLDEVTAKPVIAADITAGAIATSTDSQGKFAINVPAGVAVVTVRRTGYQPFDIDVSNLIVNTTVAVRMRSTQTVRVRLTAGTNLDLDIESVQFAYLVPFSGYARTDYAKFCRDGTEIEQDRGTIQRITGPADNVTNALCCSRGPIRSVMVQLRTGETYQAYFVDSCFGMEVDFVGRNHLTGQYEYLNFAKVAEIVFP